MKEDWRNDQKVAMNLQQELAKREEVILSLQEAQ
jgi:hypothetical protein